MRASVFTTDAATSDSYPDLKRSDTPTRAKLVKELKASRWRGEPRSSETPEIKPETRHIPMVCDQLATKSFGIPTLTYKGDVAHEADGITDWHGSQPCQALSSPECPASGLPQGGKPTQKSGIAK